MKRGTPRHPKMVALASALDIPICHAVGVMECLWHFTSDFAIEGDIGRHPNQAIADACHWEDDADIFVQCLIATGWIDDDPVHGLLVHDWNEHADNGVKAALRAKGLDFKAQVSGLKAQLSGLKAQVSGLKAEPAEAEAKAEAEAEAQNGKIASGDTFNAAGDFSRLREVVPARRVAGMTACRNALAVALINGADVEHIIEQAKAYYLTPHAKGQFGWGLLAFIRDGHCDDDPAAWQDRDQETPARSSSFNRTPEEDAIYVARRLREMAEDR